MGTIRDSRRAAGRQYEPSQAVFQQQWQIYRTMVEENYLFHREAYACLHRILVEEAVQPFRFLDIACGDASASTAALKGTRIAHYHGIDLSAAALDLARQALAALACPVTLQHADFVEALGDHVAPVDVAWIGLSLHHLQTPEKLAVMRQLRRIVGEDGLLLLYEIASPDGEDRAGWLRRYERQHLAWTAYSPADWAVMWTHVQAADFPETSSRWQGLGREAGFDQVQEVFIAPSNLLRMYRMNAIPS